MSSDAPPSGRPIASVADATRKLPAGPPTDRVESFRLPVIGLALALCGCAFALWIDRRVEAVLEPQIAAVLSVTLDTAAAGVLPVLETASNAALAAASDAGVRRAMADVLACLDHSSCFTPIAAAIDPFLRHGGFIGVDVADRAGALRGGWLTSYAMTQLPDALLERGRRPLSVAAAIVADEPRLFFLVPVDIRSSAVTEPHQLTLVFALAMSSWTRALYAARPGPTGETYAFDRKGRMLSDSRFAGQLHKAGLLPAAENSTFGLPLRDPGYDTTVSSTRARMATSARPLTRMAAAAVTGASGVETRPYRDYRGVSVVGAFRFFPEYDLGLTCEIDYASAFETVTTLQSMLQWLAAAFLLAALALAATGVVSARLRQRVQNAERLVARFGQYRLVRKVGEGGMGAVYLASHEMLRRPAAIKVLRPERASPEAIARFEREVRVTATLKHPNTVAVYDYGRTERGDLFYVMEYLEGLDLENLVARFGPMPAGRVVHYLRQLCGSLAEAHAAQLVHRDIKPANLLACRVGGVADTLKVVDFGVAKELTGEALGLTVDKLLVGTPEYMAPELFESSDRASPQSDVYSVGAVAYFLLTGQPVFEAKSLAELCLAQLTKQPDPPSLRLGAAVDAQLQAAIMACLAKRREQRPQSARSLLSLLERAKVVPWTAVDAEAWWNAHADELQEVRASRAPVSPAPEFTRLRPAARA